uniref:C2H2-type domain-containing protein n=1 Tax=Monopterus albus TaxID=43700 RepID=A0A3Q3JJ31_MONAL
MKRRARMFGCKRPQPDEGHKALSQINVMDQSSIPQHQHRDSVPHIRNPDEDLMAPNPAASSSSCGHSRSSSRLKRFSCTYCDKSFMRFSQLKEHLRSHTGEKPFSCLQCGRSFTKQCNLIRHAVVHSGEKPYECSLCGKCFTQRSSLKSHQKTRIHTGEKPYTCETCGKCFSQRSNLRTHQRTHKEALSQNPV